MSRKPKPDGRRKKAGGMGGQRSSRPARRENARILLAVEGEKTEPAYCKWLSEQVRGRYPVVIQWEHSHSDPENVVELAIHKRDNDRSSANSAGDGDDQFDEVWAIVDIDDHAGLEKAKELADRRSVRFALSGPCFETWLIMHFRGHSRFQRAKDNKALWEKTNPRHNSLDFRDLRGQLHTALSHARNQRQAHADRPLRERNPYTDVDQVIVSIAKHAKLSDPSTLY